MSTVEFQIGDIVKLKEDIKLSSPLVQTVKYKVVHIVDVAGTPFMKVVPSIFGIHSIDVAQQISNCLWTTELFELDESNIRVGDVVKLIIMGEVRQTSCHTTGVLAPPLPGQLIQPGGIYIVAKVEVSDSSYNTFLDLVDIAHKEHWKTSPASNGYAVERFIKIGHVDTYQSPLIQPPPATPSTTTPRQTSDFGTLKECREYLEWYYGMKSEEMSDGYDALGYRQVIIGMITPTNKKPFSVIIERTKGVYNIQHTFANRAMLVKE